MAAIDWNAAGPKNGLFRTLRADAAEVWQAYTQHAFVAGLGDGSLPEAAFRHYLIQDYIFLVNYARAYALGVYKADTIAEMRYCQKGVAGILDGELQLHISYCRDWGLSEADVLAAQEDKANVAYTRYVFDRGNAGDYLDLLVALIPCAIGYAEIGARLLADPASKSQGNPYWPWIESYGGEAFQDLGLEALDALEAAAAARIGDRPKESPRYRRLLQTFTAATELEVDFWQMGLRAAHQGKRSPL